MTKEIINGVEITHDGNVTHFRPIDNTKTEKVIVDQRSWFQKVVDWCMRHEVSPYVAIKDIADPTGDRAKDIDDIDAGNDSKQAVEVGIKLSF